MPGISGGKDSSIVAALCVEAIGKDRVIGVLMPNGEQADIDKAKLLVDTLGIGTFCSNDTCEKALNIVIKLQYVNGRPVAKLSDNPEKSMCRDEQYLEYLKRSVAFRLDREKNS